MSEQEQKPAVQPKDPLRLIQKDVVDVVAGRVADLVNNGSLHLPEHYSAQNAMKAAWLALQNVEDKDGNKALGKCTNDSIANSLLDMIVQGLNPSKNQCYFVVFGKQLVLMRSRFGTVALVQRICGQQASVWSECVYAGDDFEWSLQRGRKTITKHTQALERIDSEKILAAYAVVDPGDGRPEITEIMTRDQITKAWSMGGAKGVSKAHKKFSDEMCKKTVTNRACKMLINSSDDHYLKEAVQRQDVAIAEAETEAVAELEANNERLDFPETEIVDSDQGSDAKDVVDVPAEHLLTKEQADAIDEIMDPAEEKEPETVQETESEDSEPEANEPSKVDESVVKSPSTLFAEFIDENDLDATLARKVAADIVRLDDVRKLSNGDIVDVLSDSVTFMQRYVEAVGKNQKGQPSLL